MNASIWDVLTAVDEPRVSDTLLRPPPWGVLCLPGVDPLSLKLPGAGTLTI